MNPHVCRDKSLLLIVLFSLLVVVSCSRSSDPDDLDMSRSSDMESAIDMRSQPDLSQPPPDQDTQDSNMDMPDAQALDMSSDMKPKPQLLDPNTLISDDDILAAVNPFIGSGGVGFGYAAMTPLAQVPLGLAKVGPDTTRQGIHASNQHMSGYHYDDPHVRGFSHLHFVGTGVADYGNLRTYPARNLDKVGTRRWFATQDKAQEEASPGYYKTVLVEPDTQVELTATLRGAAHRYTFNGPSQPALLAVDIASSVRDSGVQDLAMTINPSKKEISGWVLYKGGYVGRRFPFTLHFAISLSHAPDDAFVWNDNGLDEAVMSLDAGQSSTGGAVLRWDDTPSEPVEMRVGLSLVDLESARAHLEEEVGWQRSFDDIHQAARDAWLQRLSSVRVAGGTQSERNIFYTALYNAFRMPTRLDTLDGRYPGLDGQVHDTTHPYYTDLSLWDSFRTTHPLYNLIAPDVQRDVLLSLLTMRRDGGVLPKWPAGTSYTGGMVGSSADMLLGESAAKGLQGVDWEEALAAVLETADNMVPETAIGPSRSGIGSYLSHGYVAAEESSGSASVTLEYAYNDWAISHLAKVVGQDDVAARFEQRSLSYRNIFDPDTGFFRAKTLDGQFVPGFKSDVSEDRSGENFVEGSAWHYRFYALQDIEGLVTLIGGADVLAMLLEQLFEQSSFGDQLLGRNSLPDVYYWHGNQPPLHSVSLFAFSSTPERQYHWLEEIRTRYYDETPAGLPGNDDGGTLSSWYVLHALGLYPVAGSADYILSVPIFTHAVVELGDAHTVEVKAPHTAPWSRVVNAVKLDEQPVSTPRVSHGELVDKTLVFDVVE